jgi:hypothetical protein
MKPGFDATQNPVCQIFLTQSGFEPPIASMLRRQLTRRSFAVRFS